MFIITRCAIQTTASNNMAESPADYIIAFSPPLPSRSTNRVFKLKEREGGNIFYFAKSPNIRVVMGNDIAL